MAKLIVVMGVSGCGKSSVAKGLAERLGGDFFDADDFHSPDNVAKMAAGQALDDADRAGWLQTLATLLRRQHDRARTTILACSALKESYRQTLRVTHDVRFLFLEGDYELITARMAQRPGHFMKPGMLASQFATLEVPASGPGTDVFTLEISDSVSTIVERAADFFLRTESGQR